MRARATRPGHGAVSGDVTAVMFGPAADRRNAADRAHRGDLEGALGVISAFDTGPRRGAGRRLAALSAVLGPGLVVMAADNDAGGISTYAQAGQDYGVRIAWLVVLLVPVLFVCQEMAARLGAVTGAGHARLITARFGRRWGGFALADLLALNLLTLVTEFVGVSLSLGYFGISRLVSVPAAAAFLIAVTASGSFRGWERAMYVLIAASLAAVPLAVIAWAHRGQAAASAATAHGGAVFLAVALVGTTVAPWQLFFQQSNVVDKRITTRFLGYERADTALGTVLFAVGALGVLLACGFAFGPAGLHGAFTDAAAARGLRTQAGGGRRGAVRGRARRRVGARRQRGDPGHLLRRRRLLRPAALAAPPVAPGQDLPPHLRRLRPGRRRGRAHPAGAARAADHRRPGPGRDPAAQRDGVPAAAVQRPRGPRAAGQPALAQRPGQHCHRRPTRLVSAAHRHDHRAAPAAGPRRHRPGGRHRGPGHGRGPDRRPRPARPGPGPADRRTWTMPPIESLRPPARSAWRTLGLVVLRCYLLAAVIILAVRAIQLALGSG